MKLNPSDWRKLQLSLAAFLALSLAGGTLVFYSQEKLQRAKIQLAGADAQKQQAEGKLKQVKDEESEIKLKASLFSNLVARGIVGEEQRLDWVELLRDIRNNRRIIDMQYEFAPQQTMPGTLGNWNFYVSTMQLQMQLLHEEDLLNVLADLRNTAKAQILVKACETTRLPRQEAATGIKANLQAQCSLDWVTVRGPLPH